MRRKGGTGNHLTRQKKRKITRKTGTVPGLFLTGLGFDSRFSDQRGVIDGFWPGGWRSKGAVISTGYVIVKDAVWDELEDVAKGMRRLTKNLMEVEEQQRKTGCPLGYLRQPRTPFFPLLSVSTTFTTAKQEGKERDNQVQ